MLMEELRAIHSQQEDTQVEKYALQVVTTTGKDWESFLANGENKTELIHFLSIHYRSKNVYQSLKTPLMITDGELTWQIDNKVMHLFQIVIIMKQILGSFYMKL